jgi:hypothetical protein
VCIKVAIFKNLFDIEKIKQEFFFSNVAAILFVGKQQTALSKLLGQQEQRFTDQIKSKMYSYLTFLIK